MESALRDVSTTEVLATRSFDDEVPEWLANTEPGDATMRIRRWDEGQVVISVSLAMQGENHAVKVTISGLYDIEGDVFGLPEDDQDSFARDQVQQLNPFLRQAVYNASALVWPVQPIMLDVSPDSWSVTRRVVADDSSN